MKEPHHLKKVGIGMIMVAASLALIGILQISIGPDVLFGDTIQRQQVADFEDCKVNGFQEPQCAKWIDEMQLQECRENKDIDCLLYTSPSPRDGLLSRMPSSA